MITYNLLGELPFEEKTVLTVGTFDGVHRGHRAIIEQLLNEAQSLQARAVVVTFDPHPQIVLRNKPDKPPVTLLSTIEERLQLLERYGVTNVVIIPFSEEFAAIDSETFVREYLVGKIGCSKILVGYDHSFGRNREGNLALLERLSQELHFSVEQMPPLYNNDVTISSTKIRNALRDGDLALANTMLGYEYFIEGRVVMGDGRGKQLGLPTANVRSTDDNKLLPKNGVYLVSAIIENKLCYGMANVGVRPTFTHDEFPSLEVHFFGIDSDLYDTILNVSFLRRIRNEQKFDSIDLFLSQIVEDRETCYELIEQIEKK